MKTNHRKNIILIIIFLLCCLGIWGIYVNECKISSLIDFYSAINDWKFGFIEKTDTLLKISIDSTTVKLYFINRIEIYNLKN